MSSPRSFAAVLGALRAEGVVPRECEIAARRGTCRWEERGLQLCLRLELANPLETTPLFTWQLVVSDGGRLGDPQDVGGLDATVAVQAVPGDGDHETRAQIRAAREFVTDPADLAWLLSQEEDVVRGDLYAWLYQKWPARLVKALQVAKGRGASDLVQAIEAVLRSGARVEVRPGRTEDILTVARRRAEDLSRDTGLSIDLPAHTNPAQR